MPCIDCGRDYRTYVPDTACHLPDGGIVTYSEPQLKCPACDDQCFGLFMTNPVIVPFICKLLKLLVDEWTKGQPQTITEKNVHYYINYTDEQLFIHVNFVTSLNIPSACKSCLRGIVYEKIHDTLHAV